MSKIVSHDVIYREPGRFAGWPANYGIWSWGDEIVVAFTVGSMSLSGGFHKRDRSKPFTTMQARSLDGGETWDMVPAPLIEPGGVALSALEHQAPEARKRWSQRVEGDLLAVEEPIDFTHPDLALLCGRTGTSDGAVSWFYSSTDRCASWSGPYRIPGFGMRGIAARTDYVVDDAESCTFFLTAAKSDGREGRTFCARTEDGGQTLVFRSWIGPEPDGYAIMPSTVRLPDGALLTAIRRKEGAEPTADYWIELYRSDDDALTWRMTDPRVASTGGNPPSMIPLRDGRLCLTYGYRIPPTGLRAKLSDDQGATWGDEIVLRDDGGDGDLGYPRTVQRADGKVVAVYYYNDDPDAERFIGVTIWEP